MATPEQFVYVIISVEGGSGCDGVYNTLDAAMLSAMDSYVYPGWLEAEDGGSYASCPAVWHLVAVDGSLVDAYWELREKEIGQCRIYKRLIDEFMPNLHVG